MLLAAEDEGIDWGEKKYKRNIALATGQWELAEERWANRLIVRLLPINALTSARPRSKAPATVGLGGRIPYQCVGTISRLIKAVLKRVVKRMADKTQVPRCLIKSGRQEKFLETICLQAGDDTDWTDLREGSFDLKDWQQMH